MIKLYSKRTPLLSEPIYTHHFDFDTLQNFNEYMKHIYNIDFNDLLKETSSIAYKIIMINLQLKGTNLVVKNGEL